MWSTGLCDQAQRIWGATWLTTSLLTPTGLLPALQSCPAPLPSGPLGESFPLLECPALGPYLANKSSRSSLCITSSRTLPGPSRPHLHDRMDCHPVSLVARTDIFQNTCILCWSCLPTCLPDLNSKVNLIIRKTCMYFV